MRTRNRRRAPAGADEQALRTELQALIRSGRFLLIGTMAVNAYTEHRVPQDEDYLVDDVTFRSAVRWLKRGNISFRSSGDAVKVGSLHVDIVRAASHPTLMAVFRSESLPGRTVIPTQEAVAATKFVAAISPSRSARSKRQDVLDFVNLVTLPDFNENRFLSFMRNLPRQARAEARNACRCARAGETVAL